MDKWYILLCKQHNKHFGDNPLRGAAKHLWSKSHNKQSRTYAQALETFGIEVLNCDAEKQRVNNDAFLQALEEGYQPLNNTYPYKKRRPVSDTRSQVRRSIEETIPEPVPGDIYLARWPGLRGFVGIVVLPRDCFGDPSFEDLGLEGSLADITFLRKDIPACYRTCVETGRITGWAEEYDDGGPKADQREYPVMLLDADGDFRSLAWHTKAGLREYHSERWSDDEDLISNLAWIHEFEIRRERAKATAIRSPPPAPVSTVIPQAEPSNISPKTAACSSATPQAMESTDRADNISNPQRGLEVNSDASERGQSTSFRPISPRRRSLPRPVTQNIQGRIMGHAPTHVDTTPHFGPRRESAGSAGDGRVRFAGREPQSASSAAPNHDLGSIELGSNAALPGVPVLRSNHASPRERYTPQRKGKFHSKSFPNAQSAANSQGNQMSSRYPPTAPQDRSSSASASHSFRGQGVHELPLDPALVGNQSSASSAPSVRNHVGLFTPFKRSFEHPVQTLSDNSGACQTQPAANGRQV